jgi:two-component system, chemotaxis family, sensor kinase CheA
VEPRLQGTTVVSTRGQPHMSDSDIVKKFLAESYENLDRLGRELVELEKDLSNPETLASVFRTIHTIKGTCGFLRFEKLEKVAHVGENLLSQHRDGVLKLDPEITTALVQMVDAVRQMLGEIQATGQGGKAEYKDLQNTLARLQSGESAGLASVKPAVKSADTLKTAPEAGSPVAKSGEPENKPHDSTGDPQKHQPMAGRIGGMLVARGILSPEDLAFGLRLQEPGHKRRLGESIVSLALAKQEDIASVTNMQEEEKSENKVKASQRATETRKKASESPAAAAPETVAPSARADRRETARETEAPPAAGPETPRDATTPTKNRARETSAGTIRVGVNLLDKLMTLVGELVLARNQLLQFSNTTQSAGIQAVSQRMNLITTELHEEVMKTRMQPIGNIWNQSPRTVRDVAVGCGKEVRIEMEGKETELDKAIIEAVKDPLTHPGAEFGGSRNRVAAGAGGMQKAAKELVHTSAESQRLVEQFGIETNGLKSTALSRN